VQELGRVAGGKVGAAEAPDLLGFQPHLLGELAPGTVCGILPLLQGARRDLQQKLARCLAPLPDEGQGSILM